MIPLHPGFPLRADFFFPNGDDLLETIDAVASGLENASVAVRGCAGDHHRGSLRI
jgi:hypothetical protein